MGDEVQRMCKKSDVLDAGGYVFDYYYGTYVNKSRRMLFSHQFVDAHSAEELESHIATAMPDSKWQFFCLKPPAPSVRQKLEAAYS